MKAGQASLATVEAVGSSEGVSRSVRHGQRSSNAVSAAAVDGANRAGPIGQRSDQSCTEANGVNSIVTGDPLVVVYWNVAGIAARHIDDFLFDLENEVLWDVLILIEFSAARQELHLSGVRKSGHLVCSQPYSVGRRAGALVFHSRLRIHHVELLSHGRAFGADFRWGGWRIRVVGVTRTLGATAGRTNRVSMIWSTSLKPHHIAIS